MFKLECSCYIYMLTHINARSQTRTHARLQGVAALLWDAGCWEQTSGFQMWDPLKLYLRVSLLYYMEVSCDTNSKCYIWQRCAAKIGGFSGNVMSYRGPCALQRGCCRPDKLLFRGQVTRANRRSSDRTTGPNQRHEKLFSFVGRTQHINPESGFGVD